MFRLIILASFFSAALISSPVYATTPLSLTESEFSEAEYVNSLVSEVAEESSNMENWMTDLEYWSDTYFDISMIEPVNEPASEIEPWMYDLETWDYNDDVKNHRSRNIKC